MTHPQPLESDSAQEVALSQLAPERIRRWARRIAAGDDAFPTADALLPPDRDGLATETRRLLRERLLDLIAGLIARDLLRRDRPDMEVR